MMLNLSDVLSEQHKAIKETIPIEMTEFAAAGGTYKITYKSPLDLHVSYVKDKKLDVKGRATVRLMASCDRCLEDVEIEIPLDFKRRVSTDDRAYYQTDDLDENNYIDGYSLDVEQLIYNELLTGWPTKILCNDDCKGICNVCGQNLNKGTCGCEDTGLDPRMSVIRDVFKNFKEV